MIQGEHREEHADGYRKRCRLWEYSSCQYNEEGPDHAEGLPSAALFVDMQEGKYLLECRFQKESQHDDNAIIQSVGDVLELCSMPKSNGQERTELSNNDWKQLPYPVSEYSSEAFACLAEELGHGDGIEYVIPAPVGQ